MPAGPVNRQSQRNGAFFSDADECDWLRDAGDAACEDRASLIQDEKDLLAALFQELRDVKCTLKPPNLRA